MSVDEFSRYWHDIHGPIGHRIPGLRRLVQSLYVTARGLSTSPIPHPDGMAPPPFDGMAELWFDDLVALRAAQHSPEWQASSEDEDNFIDKTRTALFLTEEREIAG